MVDPKLIEEIRKLTKLVIELPERLMKSLANASGAYGDWRARIAAQREIGAVREIGKKLQDVYFFKGDFLSYIKSLDLKDDANIEYMRELFAQVSYGLDELRQIMEGVGFSDSVLATEAAMFIAHASRAYESLLQRPDDELRDRTELVEIAEGIERMANGGLELMKRLDDSRRLLDGYHIWDLPEQSRAFDILDKMKGKKD